MQKNENQKKIAIVGNPNAGKTTLFNGLTGAKQTIGNWPGVTVEKVTGTMIHDDQKIHIVDLPGIYSLSASSEDEKVSRDFILSGDYDYIINIVDASNIERNLYLTSQLIEMDVPLLIVLNKTDVIKRRDTTIDSQLLSKKLGITVLETNSTKNSEIARIKDMLISEFENTKKPSENIEYPNEIENAISRWSKNLEEYATELNVPTRWLAVKLLERDVEFSDKIVKNTNFTESELNSSITKIESLHKESTDIIIADYKYGFIHSIVKSIKKRNHDKQQTTDVIDKFVLNKFLGIPIFLLIMYFIFWFTMNIGGAFIDFFDIVSGAIFIDQTASLLTKIHAPEWLIFFISEGIGSGLQVIATFIPVIFSMFLMLSILEDSGYMARAAFIADKLMRKVGLPGKSFVPMIVGFGCTVPAVMATRTLENRQDRIMTVFMSPFMSCGARLPVYVVFAAAFFGSGSGKVVFSLYLVGIAVAMLTGIILKKTVFKGEVSYFVMELPTYNYPRLKHIMYHTWNRLKVFILQAGKVIIIGVFILSFLNSIGTDFSFGNQGTEKSVLSSVGKAITPIFTPMGIEEDNWPASVSLFSGIFAKEAIVGSLGSLYVQLELSDEFEKQDDSEGLFHSVAEAMQTTKDNLMDSMNAFLDPLGLGMIDDSESEIAGGIDISENIFPLIQKNFNYEKWRAYAYLLFVLVYFPCLAAAGAIIREVGWKYGLLSMGYSTILAWVIATIFFQVTTGHSFPTIIVASVVLILIVMLFIAIGKLEKNKLMG